MSRILIVEDEAQIATFIAKGLRTAGFESGTAADGAAALQAMTAEFWDLVVLDLGLPDQDGFTILRRLRREGTTTPVIILTARTSITDTVAGLESGADDYMAKPFRFEELLARIRLRLRTDPPGEPAALEYGSLRLDLRTRRATSRHGETDLSAREFDLLAMFLRNSGAVLSRDQILDRIWGFDFDPGSNIVDVYVRYLRNKIGAEYFETVRGVGYRLVVPK